MDDLSRRKFFRYLTLNALNTVLSGMARASRTFAALTPDSSKAIPCARCNVRFTLIATEEICPNCQQVESKQQGLIAQIKKEI